MDGGKDLWPSWMRVVCGLTASAPPLLRNPDSFFARRWLRVSSSGAISLLSPVVQCHRPCTQRHFQLLAANPASSALTARLKKLFGRGCRAALPRLCHSACDCQFAEERSLRRRASERARSASTHPFRLTQNREGKPRR
jgi:hypothetical protein